MHAGLPHHTKATVIGPLWHCDERSRIEMDVQNYSHGTCGHATVMN